METVRDFIFWGSEITADGGCSHESKRHLLLGRKAMTNLDSIFKNRDITLPTKSIWSKLWFFPVVMYGCEGWTIKKKWEESESEVAQSCPTLWTPWTVAYEAPPSMEFFRQECWSGLPFPSPGDLPDPAIEPGSPTLQADSLLSEPEHRRIDAFELWCWRRLLRVPWTARRSNLSILMKSVLNIHWKAWCWSWNFNILATDAKNYLIGKDPDAGKDWREEEKGTTEDEMVG